MILIAVVAAPAGWVANRIHGQRQAIATVRAAGGQIRFDYHEQQIQPRPHYTTFRTEPAAPAWLRRWLGDELFQEVREVNFQRFDQPEALAALARFDRLRELQAWSTIRAGDGFRHLRRLTHLRAIQVSGAGIDDAALADIAGLAGLRDLSVARATATDAGFARLAALPEVVALTVGRNPQHTDAGLARLLAGLPRLRYLKLADDTRSTPLALTALAEHHPDLEVLNLSRSGVVDADLAAVGRIAGLAELDLTGTAITGAGLAHLAPLARLRKLTLAEMTGLTDEGLAAVGQIAGLEELDLGTTYVGDAGLPRLAPLGRLTRLDLMATDVTDAGLAALARLPALRSLSLDGNPQITDSAVPALLQCPRLRQVHFGGPGTTDPGRSAFLGPANAGSRGERILGYRPASAKRLPPRIKPTPGR